MGFLAKSDEVAGGVARTSTTLAQMALVVLGVHLAADQLDDQLLRWFQAAWAWALGVLTQAPTWLGVDAEGQGARVEALMPAAAAWLALGAEIGTTLLLWGGFLLTRRDKKPVWKEYKRALSVRAVVLPLALAGILLAGAWSMAMAVEDLLPAHPATTAVGAAIGLATLVRYGWPAWARSVATLNPDLPRTQGLAGALLLAPMGLLAWMHGVPFWGLLRLWS